jgi:hypothetical protein
MRPQNETPAQRVLSLGYEVCRRADWRYRHGMHPFEIRVDIYQRHGKWLNRLEVWLAIAAWRDMLDA